MSFALVLLSTILIEHYLQKKSVSQQMSGLMKERPLLSLVVLMVAHCQWTVHYFLAMVLLVSTQHMAINTARMHSQELPQNACVCLRIRQRRENGSQGALATALHLATRLLAERIAVLTGYLADTITAFLVLNYHMSTWFPLHNNIAPSVFCCFFSCCCLCFFLQIWLCTAFEQNSALFHLNLTTHWLLWISSTC